MPNESPSGQRDQAVLVTGSAGHLGEAVMRYLRAAGRSAVGLDLKASAFTNHVGSICDKGFVARCMQHVSAVVHAATLHKPHVATHSWQDFVEVNVTGTLHLLEAAVAAGVRSFIYVSTTSTFGEALYPAAAEPAIWVTETLIPRPKNIYGSTKLMAEGLCELAHRQRQLPIMILRTSRFFPEPDDAADIRHQYQVANAQANELLYRRVDIEDVVSALVSAIDRAPRIGFCRYIISATTPFSPNDLELLRRDAAQVVGRLFPEYVALYAARGWTMFPRIDRVYVNERARTALEWQPKYDFAHVLDCLRANRDFHSALAREVGSKGYHDRDFGERPYPVD
ncbi:MAG TPA: NAD(P)-dependent oxidoreductase [Steroidobacteraceae bacterium]